MPNAVASPSASLVPIAMAPSGPAANSGAGTNAAVSGDSADTATQGTDFASVLDATVTNAAQGTAALTASPLALLSSLAADVDVKAEAGSGESILDLSALLPMIAAHFAAANGGADPAEKPAVPVAGTEVAPPLLTAPALTAAAADRSRATVDLGAGTNDDAVVAAAPLTAATGRTAILADKLTATAESAAAKHGAEVPTAAAVPERAASEIVLPPPGSAHRPASDTAPVLRVDTPVTAAHWGEDVAQKVMWVANRNEGRAELVLTPPQLGRLEVSVAVKHDGEMSLMFVSANQQVRDSLEQSLPRLREILADAGIALGQAGVQSDSAPRDGAAFQGRARNDNAPPVSGASPASAAPASQRQGAGLVDTFA